MHTIFINSNILKKNPLIFVTEGPFYDHYGNKKHNIIALGSAFRPAFNNFFMVPLENKVSHNIKDIQVILLIVPF